MAVEAQFALVYDGRRLALFEGDTTLGRALSCQIRFNAPSVSREHLRLRVSGGRISGENLSSSVGTTLNGKALHGTMPLFHGDALQLGQVEVRIERVDGLPLDGPGRPMADDGLPEEATILAGRSSLPPRRPTTRASRPRRSITTPAQRAAARSPSTSAAAAPAATPGRAPRPARSCASTRR